MDRWMDEKEMNGQMNRLICEWVKNKFRDGWMDG